MREVVAGVIIIAITLAIATLLTFKYIPTLNITPKITINASCDMIKNAVNPQFDYCSSRVTRVRANEYEYECKCCWDREEEYGFKLCKFYGIRVFDNTTELWEIYPNH